MKKLTALIIATSLGFLFPPSLIRAADSNSFTTYSDLNATWSEAKKNRQPVLIYLVNESSGISKKFDSEIIKNEKLKTLLGWYVLSRLNVDSDQGKEIEKKYHWNKTPFLAVLNQEGESFGVLDFSSMGEQLVNKDLVQQVGSWLEKERRRFDKEPDYGYQRNEIAKDDPIRAVIEKWRTKKVVYEKEKFSLLLDEVKIKVERNGSSTSRYHIVSYLGKEAADGERLWRGVFSKNTRFKLIRARTITSNFKENLMDSQEAEEVPIYRNYPELDRYRSVSFNFPGAKGGCYTELEYELTQEAQMPNHFSFSWTIESNNILSLDSFLELEAPASMDLQYKVVENTVQPKVETINNITKFSWKGESQHFQHREENEAHSSTHGRVVLAAKTSWEEIGRWFLRLCEQSKTPSPEVDALVAQTVKQLTPGDKYEKRLVNVLMERMGREFRYLAFNIDESGYVPHSPSQTFENKYGDCKDLSLFLQECLKQAGVSSDLVLLQSGSVLELEKELPRVPYFTHCILRVNTGKEAFYVDPTAFNFAAGAIPYPDCSTGALICGANKIELTSMPSVEKAGGFYLDAEFSALDKTNVKSSFEVKLVSATKEALRRYYSGLNQEELKRLPKRLFEKVFDQFNAKTSEISGEQVNAEVFRMTFSGETEKPFISGDRLIEVPTFLNYENFGLGLPQYCSKEHEEKNYGLYTGHRRAPVSQRIKYTIPSGYEIQEIPKEFHVSTDYFDVKRSVESKSNQVIVETEVVIKFVSGESQFIPAEKLPEEARKIKDRILKTIVFQKGASQNIFEACEKGELAQVKELVAEGIDLEIMDSKGQTPLHVASRAGKKEVVEFLIEKGSKINAQNTAGETSLFLACDRNKPEVAKILADAGADLEVATKRGFRPLMGASNHSECVEVIKLLLAKGAHVNELSDFGTALYFAVKESNLEAINILFKAGADPYILASEKEFGETFCYPLLGLAACKGKLETIKTLIVCGIDINRPAREGTTALMLAAGFGQPEAVTLLLEKGAKIDIQTQDGDTALSRAVKFWKSDIVKILLDHKADVNVQDLRGKTPLMIAAAHKDKSIAKVLIEGKADVNLKASEGETAMAIAMNLGDREMMELLRSHGAAREEARIIPPEKRKNPLPENRAWAVALTAVYYQVHSLDIQYLGGTSEPNPKDEKASLKSGWDIKNKDDLFNALENLRDKGQHVIFQLQGAKLAEMNNEVFEKYVTGPTVNPSKVEGIRFLRQNYLHWKDRTGLAWDWVRYIIVTGMGYSAGYLTEDEAFGLILPVAEQLQKTFSSWDEMGSNYVEGRKVWAGNADPSFNACYQLLINKNDPNSPWNTIPWNQNLSPVDKK